MEETDTRVKGHGTDLPVGRGSLAGPLSFAAFLPVITQFRGGTVLELTAAWAHMPTVVLSSVLLAVVVYVSRTARQQRRTHRWAASGYIVSVVVTGILGYVTLAYLLTI